MNKVIIKLVTKIRNVIFRSSIRSTQEYKYVVEESVPKTSILPIYVNDNALIEIYSSFFNGIKFDFKIEETSKSNKESINESSKGGKAIVSYQTLFQGELSRINISNDYEHTSSNNKKTYSQYYTKSNIIENIINSDFVANEIDLSSNSKLYYIELPISKNYTSNVFDVMLEVSKKLQTLSNEKKQVEYQPIIENLITFANLAKEYKTLPSNSISLISRHNKMSFEFEINTSYLTEATDKVWKDGKYHILFKTISVSNNNVSLLNGTGLEDLAPILDNVIDGYNQMISDNYTILNRKVFESNLEPPVIKILPIAIIL